MNIDIFTVEEENLICAFDTSGRDALIADISGAMSDFDGDGAEMRDIAVSALAKLDAMTDAEFSALILNPAYSGDNEMEV